MPDAPKLVNLGCGSRYHREWTNIDIAPREPNVIQHDLSRGIPLPDDSCDVVYHAAVLEHIRKNDANQFLSECLRVLKPGGTIRVGVPDLEQICQIYLSKLASAANGDDEAEHAYDWMILELFDQMVRERSGGGMLDFLRQNPLPNASFVFGRIGEEGRNLVEALRKGDTGGGRRRFSWVRTLGAAIRKFPGGAVGLRHKAFLGRSERHALKIGRFRLAGEVHQWMYDRFSLSRLLVQSGFRDPVVQSATMSIIPDWTRFNLDTLGDGTVIKPDLLFVEAIKPITCDE